MHVLKSPESLNRVNGEYQLALRNNYDDYIESPFEVSGYTIATIDKINSSWRVQTDLSSELYLPNTPLMSKKYLDFSEDLYEVLPVEELSENDYLFYSKKSRNPYISGTPLLNVSKYLYDGTYDLSTIATKLATDIGVSRSFLMQALRTGVPDNQVFNDKLDRYLAVNGFEDVSEFKEQLFAENCRPFKRKLPINIYFINIIFLYLSNSFTLEDNSVALNLEGFDDIFKEQVITFLTKNLIPFHETNAIIHCYSYFLINIFKDNFDNLSLLSYFPCNFDSYFLNFFKTQSFVTGNEIVLLRLQEYFYSLGVLSSIEDFDEKIKILSTLTDYVDVGIGYLLPIKNVELVDKLILKFNT